MKLCKSCKSNKKNYGKFYGCFSCPKPPKWVTDNGGFNMHIKETVYLTDGLKSSKARIEAMRSRVILPIQRTDGEGQYYSGTRTKSGKILEKMPDIFS